FRKEKLLRFQALKKGLAWLFAAEQNHRLFGFYCQSDFRCRARSARSTGDDNIARKYIDIITSISHIGNNLYIYKFRGATRCIRQNANGQASCYLFCTAIDVLHHSFISAAAKYYPTGSRNQFSEMKCHLLITLRRPFPRTHYTDDKSSHILIPP